MVPLEDKNMDFYQFVLHLSPAAQVVAILAACLVLVALIWAWAKFING